MKIDHDQITSITNRIFNSSPGSDKNITETHRNIKLLSEDLGYPSENDFIKEIQGKIVLDAGSGVGMFAKDTFIRGINSTIYSLNPRLFSSNYRKSEKNFLNNFPAQKSHDSKSVAAITQYIPFPNNTFDLVLDSYSTLAYFNDNLPLVVQSFDEMYRVLNNNGKIISISGAFCPRQRLEEIVTELQNKNYNANLRFKTDKAIKTTIPIGIEISK